MSALVLLRSSLRRRNSFYSLSYFKPNEGINQQFSSFGRPPPWKIRLHESILKQDPSLVFAHENDVDSQNKLRNNVFSSLELTEPEPILGRYENMDNYQDAIARLVVEETISTIVSSLSRMNDDSTEKGAKKGVKRGVSVCITEKDGRFIGCHSYEPLSKADRDNLRAGGVFYLLPKASEFSPEKAILGIILLGSTKSSRCKCICVPNTCFDMIYIHISSFLHSAKLHD